MKLDKSKRLVLAILCLYLSAGLVAIIIFSKNGSWFLDKKHSIEYSFTDDGKNGEIIDIESHGIIGESGAAVQETEEQNLDASSDNDTTESDDENIEKLFYEFSVSTKVTGLRIRKEPNDKSPVLDHFKKGATGYVLEKGEGWSLVTDGKKTGFCSNNYLTFTNISVDDLPDYYPEEYKVISEEEINY